MNDLMMYLGAKGMLDLVLLVSEGAIATAICLLLVFSDSEEMELVWRIARAALAYAYGMIALRVFSGEYWTPVEPTEVLVNAIVLALVWLARGDVGLLVRAIRSLKSGRAL